MFEFFGAVRKYISTTNNQTKESVVEATATAAPATKKEPKILVIGEKGVGKSLLCMNICHILNDPNADEFTHLTRNIISHQINLNDELHLELVEFPQILFELDDLKSLALSSSVVLFLMTSEGLTNSSAIDHLRNIQKYNPNVFVIFTRHDLMPKSKKEFELEAVRHEKFIIHKVHYTGLMEDKRTLSGVHELLKYVFQYLPQSEKYIQYLTQLEQNQKITVEPVLTSEKISVWFGKSNISKKQKPTIELRKQAMEEFKKKLELDLEKVEKELKENEFEINKILESSSLHEAEVSPVVSVNAKPEPFPTKEKSSESSPKRSDFYEELLKTMEAFGYMGLELATAESLKSFNQPRDYEALQKAAKSYGFRCQNVLGDGNCFLYAVADQLNRVLNLDLSDEEIKRLGKKLREQILEHIKKNQAIYQEYFKINGEFYEKNQKNFKRIHEAMVTALSYMLNVNLIIINDNNTAPIVLKQRSPICSLYLGYEVGIHYQSLVSEDYLDPQLENLIEAAEDAFFNIQPSFNTVESLKENIYELINKQENFSVTDESTKSIAEISVEILEKNDSEKQKRDTEDAKNIKNDANEENKESHIKIEPDAFQHSSASHSEQNQHDEKLFDNQDCYMPDFVKIILAPLNSEKLSIKVFSPISADAILSTVSSLEVQNRDYAFIPVYREYSKNKYEWMALIVNKKHHLVFYLSFQKLSMIPQDIIDSTDQLKNTLGYREPLIYMPDSFYGKISDIFLEQDQGVYLVELFYFFAQLIRENIVITGSYLPNPNISENGVSLESVLAKIFNFPENEIGRIRRLHHLKKFSEKEFGKAPLFPKIPISLDKKPVEINAVIEAEDPVKQKTLKVNPSYNQIGYMTVLSNAEILASRYGFAARNKKSTGDFISAVCDQFNLHLGIDINEELVKLNLDILNNEVSTSKILFDKNLGKFQYVSLPDYTVYADYGVEFCKLSEMLNINVVIFDGSKKIPTVIKRNGAVCTFYFGYQKFGTKPDECFFSYKQKHKAINQLEKIIEQAKCFESKLQHQIKTQDDLIAYLKKIGGRYEAPGLPSITKADVSISKAEPAMIFSIGLTLIKSLKFSKVLKKTEAMISADANNDILWLLRGIALHHLGDNEEAIVCFDKSLNISEFLKSEALRYKGDSLLRLYRYKEAEECYQSALKINHKDKIILVHYAHCCILQKNYEKANSIIQEISKDDAECYPMIQLMGLYHYLSGNEDVANQCFVRVDAYYNNQGLYHEYERLNVYYNTIFCLIQVGKFNVSVNYISKGLETCSHYKPFLQLASCAQNEMIKATKEASLYYNDDINNLAIVKKGLEEKNKYIAKLEALIDQLLIKIKTNASDQGADFTHAARLEKIIDKLLSTLSQKNDQIAIVQEHNEQLETELITLRNDNQILQEKNATDEKLHDKERFENQKLFDQVKNLKHEKQVLLEQNKILINKVHALEEKHHQDKQKIVLLENKVNQLEERHNNDTKQVSALEEKVKYLKAWRHQAKEEISLLEEKVSQLEEERKQHQSIISRLEKMSVPQLFEKQEQDAAFISELEKTVKTLQESNQKYDTKITVLLQNNTRLLNVIQERDTRIASLSEEKNELPLEGKKDEQAKPIKKSKKNKNSVPAVPDIEKQNQETAQESKPVKKPKIAKFFQQFGTFAKEKSHEIPGMNASSDMTRSIPLSSAHQ